MQQKKIVVRKNEPAKGTTVTTTVSQEKKAKRGRTRRGRKAGQTSRIHPYVQSLLNPDGVRGASIPDGVSMATGTYSYVLDFTQGVDPQGRMVVYFNPKIFIGNATGNTFNTCGLLVGNTTTGFGAGGTPLVPQIANPDLSNNVERFRIVSAELQAWSSSSPLNISGRVCSALLPSDFDLGNSAVVGGFIGLSLLPNSRVSHAIEGGRALYMPGGPDDLLYASCANDVTPIHGFSTVAGTGQFHGTNFSPVSAVSLTTTTSGPTLVVGFDGLAASSSIQCRIVINIQYQAAANNAFVQLEPVEPNPTAMQQANRLASVAREVQGFYETHAESFAANFAAIAGRVAGRAAAQAGGNIMSRVTNSLLGSVGSRAGGGQQSGYFPLRLM